MSASGVADVESVARLGRTHGMTVPPLVTKPLDRALIKRVIRVHKLDIPISQSVSPSERIGLDVALREDWIEFWYQPKIDLRRKQLAGVELFARVRHPEHGILSPASFLDGADETSLMALLEKSIIDALKTGAKCAKLGINLRLAINVSMTALMKLPLLEIVREHRPKTANWPGLVFDLTEDQIASDLHLVRDGGAELQPSGMAFAIDDFGRGYLPLARLQELPRFSELKLDRSFVAGCAADKGHAAICKTVIDLAHNFGSNAVAVGVEDPADANALAKMGCDIAQGYLFAQPMVVDRFHTLLRQRAEQANRERRSPERDGKSDGAGKVPERDLVSVSRGPYVSRRSCRHTRWCGAPAPWPRTSGRRSRAARSKRPPLPWYRRTGATAASYRLNWSIPSKARPRAPPPARNRAPIPWCAPCPTASRSSPAY